MKISKAHQKFAARLNSPRALDHPEEFLGTNWKDVLNFWLFLETLSLEQWKTVEACYQELDYSALRPAQNAAWSAACCAAINAARDTSAWNAGVGTMNAAWAAAGNATLELIGSHKILSQNKSLIFLPMFLNL